MQLLSFLLTPKCYAFYRHEGQHNALHFCKTEDTPLAQ